MDTKTRTTLLGRVKLHMTHMRGQQLLDLADATGISYDTLLRIRENRVDPAFSKVQKLAEHFRVPGR